MIMKFKTFFLAILAICIFILYPGITSAMCIKATKANIRTGPGLHYPVAWVVYKFMPFKKVGVSIDGNWYAVKDVDGELYWVNKRLVTSKYRCAVVEAGQVNVRRGPGQNYSKSPLCPAYKYDSFRVLNIKRKWVKVTDGSNLSGWMHRDYIWIQ